MQNDAVSPLYQDGVKCGCGANTITPPEEDHDNTVRDLMTLMGGAESKGAYRSINITIPANERLYDIPLGIYATQINIRGDQDITMKINSTQGDDIFIEIADFPFSASELKLSESIHTLYISTGITETAIKVIAFGQVLE